jgi:hypothetical protein
MVTQNNDNDKNNNSNNRSVSFEGVKAIQTLLQIAV